MAVVYLMLVIGWSILYKRALKEHIINLHYIIYTVVVLGLVECILKLIFYCERNSKSNFEGGNLYVLLLAVEVFRLTLCRILTLLTALGLDIVIKSVENYQFQLILFSFMFIISLIAHLSL